MPTGRPPAGDEAHVAGAIREVFLAVGLENPVFRRMLLRLENLGSPVKDEVEAFKVLQRACNEEGAIAEGLAARELIDPRDCDTRRPSAEVGRLVQGFARFIDENGVRWLRKKGEL